LSIAITRRPASVSVWSQPGCTQLTIADEAKPWISSVGAPFRSPSSK